MKIGALEITEEEVRKRKAYLEITPDDERRLREAQPLLRGHAKAIIDRFYDYLLSHEHTRKILSDPGLLERLKGLQTTYFDELTAGVYDVAYFENRVKVGLAHHRFGLSPEWYLGAYVKYLHVVSDVLSAAFGRDYERYFQTTVSLTKIIYLDTGLALDAYYFAGQDEREQLHRAKRQLTDMIVHDLQNPLAGITSFLQLLKGSIAPSARAALDEALRRCDDLSAMIMNVLQISRAESGKLQTYIENVDLAQVAQESVQAFTPVAEAQGHPLSLEAGGAVVVRTDQTLLRRMLHNLLRNAIRHTPQGTRIRVRVEKTESGGRLIVSDDGPGIPRELQPKIFELFGGSGVRVDSGLGLAFCKVAAQALGTDITAESDGKKGTSFSIRFGATDLKSYSGLV